MKWRKLSAAKVLAIGTCIGLVHHAKAAFQQQQPPVETKAKDMSAFSVQNIGKHVCNQFNLVCDSTVVDTINCIEYSDVICSNDDCKVKQTFFIDMAEPCFEYPAQRARTESTDEPVSALDGADDEVGPAADLEDSGKDVDDLDADAVAGKQVLRKRWDEHGEHRLSKHHPHLLKPKHLWNGLCVSTGVFCGNDLFGCRFNSKGLYKCHKVGDTPQHIETCDDECKSGACDTCEESVPGPPGPPGPSGPAGPAGANGANGATGPQG
ncbi:hypothetical protein BGZ72_000666, partial [Mortierella alpina]